MAPVTSSDPMILEIPGALNVAPLNEEHVNAMAATDINVLAFAFLCLPPFFSKQGFRVYEQIYHKTR